MSATQSFPQYNAGMHVKNCSSCVIYTHWYTYTHATAHSQTVHTIQVQVFLFRLNFSFVHAYL